MKVLISFPASAMTVTPDDLPMVAEAARAVIADAKAAGVHVFAGGIDEQQPPVRVSADGTLSAELYPDSRLTGGFAVFDVTTRDDAVAWAARLATACRCAQEVRVFGDDPAG